MNNIINKFYKKSLLFQYIIWTLVTMSMFVGIFLLGTTVPPQRVVLVGAIVSLVVSLVPVYFGYMLNKTDKFFEGLKNLENKIETIDDELGLLALRVDVINYKKENAPTIGTMEAANKIITIIDTRLKYEFNYE